MKEALKKLDSFLCEKAKEGISSSTLENYKYQILQFLRNGEEFSEKGIDSYFKRVTRQKNNFYSQKSIQRRKRILLRFLAFAKGQSSREKRKVCQKESPLFAVVQREAEVTNGILKIKFSGAPAPLAWLRVAKDAFDFDAEKTRQERKKHNQSQVNQQDYKRIL